MHNGGGDDDDDDDGGTSMHTCTAFQVRVSELPWEYLSNLFFVFGC